MSTRPQQHPSLPVLTLIASFVIGAHVALAVRGTLLVLPGFVPDLVVYITYGTLGSVFACWWIPPYRRFCARVAAYYLAGFK